MLLCLVCLVVLTEQLVIVNESIYDNKYYCSKRRGDMIINKRLFDIMYYVWENCCTVTSPIADGGLNLTS